MACEGRAHFDFLAGTSGGPRQRCKKARAHRPHSHVAPPLRPCRSSGYYRAIPHSLRAISPRARCPVVRHTFLNVASGAQWLQGATAVLVRSPASGYDMASNNESAATEESESSRRVLVNRVPAIPRTRWQATSSLSAHTLFLSHFTHPPAPCLASKLATHTEVSVSVRRGAIQRHRHQTCRND